MKARGRALAVFSLFAGVAAVVVAVAAFTLASSAADVVLDVETATLVPAPLPETPAPARTTTTTTSTTLPPRVPPAALTIEDLGIAQGILPVGLEDDGSMEVPDVSDIGWYLHGATPGRPGATVLVAHVWWGETAGPFHRLGTLEPGAHIAVGGNGDAVYEYTVVERTMYDKDSLPADLWRNSGPETLVLISCGGGVNNATRRYNQNIVVYAVPTQEVADRVETM